MARKKQEIALQAEIETQEEWEEMLAKEGLTVVDIYQEWAGPCKAMIGNFRRLKNELGDDNLRFTVAKSDTIDSLERYRGRCEPCFLFFAGGVLVAQVRGANSPQLLRVLTEQLAYEHRVLEGNAERKEIKDPLLLDIDTDKGDDDDEEDEGMEHRGERIIFESLPELADDVEAQRKTVSVAIIKPNVVADGKVEEIMAKIQEAGIEILEQQEKTLTDEEAREFYSHKKDEEYFDDLITFMTSGPCHVLVITKGDTGDGIVEDWRDLLGPASVEEAKESNPNSLRAQYGGEHNYVNALHGSDSQETATRELAFFFPSFTSPTVPGTGPKPKIQRTLALIRPDALKERKDEILAKIEEAGFKVAMQKEIQFSREDAEEFYKEHKGEDYFEELTNRMTNGPLLALALAREDAIKEWRELLGPKEVDKAKETAPDSLRAQFSVEDVAINQLHGSDTDDMAEKELDYFFPMQQTVAAIKPDAYQTQDEIMDRIREAGFHIAARKETELTKDVAEQFYSDHKDKEYFNDLVEHMASGPTLFMVLSREDAVYGWRSLMGPTDPSQAKEEAPESLRAQFGTDIKANAIHGSSTKDHANESLNLIFGDLEFNPDGDADQLAQSKDAKDSDSEETGEKEEGEEGQTKDGDDETKSDKGEDDGEKKDDDKDDDEKRDDGDKGSQAADDEKKDDEDKKSLKDDEKKDHDDAKSDHGDAKDDDKKDDEDTKTDDKQDDDKKDDAKADDSKEEDQKDDDKQDDDKKDDSDAKDDDKKDDAEAKDDDKKDDAEAKDDDKKDDADANTEDDKKPEDSTEGNTEDKKDDDDKKGD